MYDKNEYDKEWRKKNGRRIAEYNKEWRDKNPGKAAEYNRRSRRSKGAKPKTEFPVASPGNFVCRRCLVEKPVDRFVKSKQYARGHGSYCLPCVSEISLLRRKDTSKRRVSAGVDVGEGERFCPGCEKVKLVDDFTGNYCRSCATDKSKKWREKNPDRHRELARIGKRKRELRLKTVEGKHSPDEWKALKAQYGNKCLCCGISEPEIELTRDHVIPLSKGGSNSIDNIQPLCASCNSKKQGKTTDYR